MHGWWCQALANVGGKIDKRQVLEFAFSGGLGRNFNINYDFTLGVNG